MEDIQIKIETEPKKVVIELISKTKYNIHVLGMIYVALDVYLLENRENDEVNNTKDWVLITELRDFIHKEIGAFNEDWNNKQKGEMLTISSKLVKDTYTLTIENRPRLYILNVIENVIKDAVDSPDVNSFNNEYYALFISVLRSTIQENDGY